MTKRVPTFQIVLVLGVAASSAALAQSVPLVQPGAPGQPSRTITPEQSAALAISPRNPANVKFMQDMVIHHAQAVQMVDLLKTRTSREDMKLLGERIAISQTDEIKMMRAWLAGHGEQEPDPAAHMGMVMKGMLTPAQMEELSKSNGAQFDRLFLEGMITHHQGALDMVHAVLATPGAGEDAFLFDFMGNIEADQTAEIARMQTMLAARQ